MTQGMQQIKKTAPSNSQSKGTINKKKAERILTDHNKQHHWTTQEKSEMERFPEIWQPS